MNYPLFISCPRGLDALLADELQSLGLRITKTSPMGVYGECNQAILYHICLWSRLANRVQLILFTGNANNEQQMRELVEQFHWQTVFSPDKTIAVEFHGSSPKIRNTMYGAQVIKDGIVDHFHKQNHTRPNVDRKNPQIRIHAFLKNGELTVSLDLVGYSLHQRGYRKRAGGAPLKENVACALLMRAGWMKNAEKGAAFIDPFCGSGTLAIEAAMMSAQIAPGLLRDDQALIHWAGHQASLWQKVRTLAKQQQKTITNPIYGYDKDKRLIDIAKTNAENAGVGELCEFKSQPVNMLNNEHPLGVIVTNPPYGERLDEVTNLVPVYQELGQRVFSQCQGWSVNVITNHPMLAKAIGLRSHKQYSVFNGPIECKLYCFALNERNQLKSHDESSLSENAKMLFNRLHKNKKHLEKWLRREGIECYRLYDADIPEYAMAIDVYKDWAHVQEYAPPKTIATHKAEQRVLDMMQAIPQVLSIPPSHVVLKQRMRQKGKNQYQKVAQKKQYVEVHEHGVNILVNLKDYLDTGLFLDHRPIRAKLGEVAANKRLLNCFCYTATASLAAARNGAKTTNIDLSKTYLEWAKANFQANNINPAYHQFIHADCLQWLKQCRQKFDVIFLDPPSFSNSKRMDSTLDIQRDHVALIDAAMRLLAEDGLLYFSTNLRKFKLSDLLKEKYQIRDISQATTDEDFKRARFSHHCFVINGAEHR